MNFKVGQKVASLITTCAKKKDEVFTVTGIFNCPHCGGYHITFGVHHGFPLSSIKHTCESCNKDSGYRGLEWCDWANDFAPIIENTSTADIANQIFDTCNDVKEIKIPSLV